MNLLWAALLAYVAAGVTAIVSVVLGRRPERTLLALLSVGLLLHTLSIGLRWERLGHGPYITLFEILSSNIWSLTLVFTLAYWRIPALRPAAAVVAPVLFVMMGWLLLTSPGEGGVPATYHTIWLYIHIGMGKVFLGAVLVAVGISGLVILRWAEIATARLARLPGDDSLVELAYRFMALGLIFDTLMLITGAIWAQDAWGRYWAWDPLETWAFITWLTLAFAIHLRLTLRPPAVVSSTMVIAVFAVAFVTFFGVPFISQAPHKGAI
jgi:ABC-type transport system involved in cytochrome c biogenesis permease subunit